MWPALAYWGACALFAGAIVYALLIATDPLGEPRHDPFHDDVFGDVPALPSDLKTSFHAETNSRGGQHGNG
jgi:hypothetical protein